MKQKIKIFRAKNCTFLGKREQHIWCDKLIGCKPKDVISVKYENATPHVWHCEVVKHTKNRTLLYEI